MLSGALRLLAAAALLALLPAAGVGQTPTPPAGGFRLPVDCRPNEDCWVANYVDVIAGPGEADFHCSSRTYDDHDGVDIAIRDLQEMARGVAVLAGAPGVVTATRDGETDKAFVESGAAAVAGRECGNGVRIDYGNGWNAQFCHLQRGSIRVKMGDPVAATTTLGLVGMSGKAVFPHLHWTLRHGETVLDPFTGRAPGAACVPHTEQHSLWHPAAGLAYTPFNLYAVGFADRQPGDADITADARGPGILSIDSRTFGAWAAIFGVRPHDKVTMRIFDPGGQILLEGRYDVSRTRAREIPYLSRARPSGSTWPPGRYGAEVSVERMVDGQPVRQTRGSSVELR